MTTQTTTDAAFWNGLAEGYAAQPVKDPAAFDRKIALTKARMAPDHVVLDIGCGTGSLAFRLADSAAQVHGLDVSSEMVRIARGKAAAQGVGNVTFHVGPFDDSFSAFAPESLDGICAYSILHLLRDPDAALRRIYALLKPGGFFVSSTAALRETWLPLGLVVRVMRVFGKAPYVANLSTRGLIDSMRAAGFVDITTPDVGAKPVVAFIMASKPA